MISYDDLNYSQKMSLCYLDERPEGREKIGSGDYQSYEQLVKLGLAELTNDNMFVITSDGKAVIEATRTPKQTATETETAALSLADILFWNDPDQPTERTAENLAEMTRLDAEIEQRKAQNEATIQTILAKGFLAATPEDWQTLKELGAADYDYDYSDSEGEAMPLKLKKGYTFQISDTDLWSSGD